MSWWCRWVPPPHVPGDTTLPLQGQEQSTACLVQRSWARCDSSFYLGTHVRHCHFTPQLIANDTGNPTDCCSTATVTIDLIDTNDHIPEFPQSTYNLRVMENSPDGTIIATNITVRAEHSSCPLGSHTSVTLGATFWGAQCPHPVPHLHQ